MKSSHIQWRFWWIAPVSMESSVDNVVNVYEGAKVMNVEYIYCPRCGYEDFDVYVAYSRATADAKLYLCPRCGEETSNVGQDESVTKRIPGPEPGGTGEII